jgi:hypothetical protein
LLVIALLAILFESSDPFIGGLPQDAEPSGKLTDAVVVQLIVFEEPLSLFAHGNTPGDVLGGTGP